MIHDHELPMLAWIAGVIHWLEELASLLSGPILTAGLAIALIDLLTDGKLLASAPLLLFVWAASQAVGLDAQLVGAAAKLGAAMRRRAGWAIIGYAVLVVALGIVAFQASNVFATQEASGITTAAALARLGMDSASWLIERSALAVVLVILSGLLRYAAPRKMAISLEDERATLARELELEPMRQRLRAQQVGGLRALAVTALQGAGAAQNAQTGIGAPATFEAASERPTATQEGRQDASQTQAASSIIAPTPDKPPTGPGSPSVGSNPRRKRAPAPAVLRLAPPPRQSKRAAANANARSGRKGDAEKKIRAALASSPDLGFDELVIRTGVSRATASKWVNVIAAERANAGQVAQ